MIDRWERPWLPLEEEIIDDHSVDEELADRPRRKKI
jgi:hypothetical protein